MKKIFNRSNKVKCYMDLDISIEMLQSQSFVIHQYFKKGIA